VQAQGPQEVFHRQVRHADVGDNQVGVPRFFEPFQRLQAVLFAQHGIGFAEGSFKTLMKASILVD
jgi:hypothetical protein